MFCRGYNFDIFLTFSILDGIIFICLEKSLFMGKVLLNDIGRLSNHDDQLEVNKNVEEHLDVLVLRVDFWCVFNELGTFTDYHCACSQADQEHIADYADREFEILG